MIKRILTVLLLGLAVLLAIGATTQSQSQGIVQLANASTAKFKTYRFEDGATICYIVHSVSQHTSSISCIRRR